MYPNDNWGKNELMGSTMQIYLNGTGDNKRSGSASTYGLKETAKNMISDAKYYLGGARNYNGYGTADAIYLWERGTETFSYETYCQYNSSNTKCTTENYCENNPTDEICTATRSKSWVGEVALMYPSDEYLVYSNGVDDVCFFNAQECDNQKEYDPVNDTFVDKENPGYPTTGWIYNSDNLEGQTYITTIWSLSPISISEHDVLKFDNHIISNSSNSFNAVRPVLYLSSNVKITDGTGEQNNPYKLGL